MGLFNGEISMDWSGLAESLLGIAGSIGGQYLGADLGSKQLEKEQEFNHNESELARQYNTAEREATQQWNLEQWNRENEYNSPAAQLERAKAAGFNPNAAVEGISGSSNAGHIQSAPQSGPAASSPGSVAGNLMDLIGNSANSIMSNALVAEQVEGLKIDNLWKNKEKDVAYRQARQNLKNSELEGEEKKIALKLQKQLYKQNELENPLKLSVLAEEINKLTAEQDLLKKQAATEDAKKVNLEANTDLLGSEDEKVQAETRRINEETLRLQWQNLFRQKFGFDPDQGWVQQLITASVEGKLPTILKSIVGANKEDPKIANLPDDIDKWTEEDWKYIDETIGGLTKKRGRGSKGAGIASGLIGVE